VTKYVQFYKITWLSKYFDYNKLVTLPIKILQPITNRTDMRGDKVYIMRNLLISKKRIGIAKNY